MSRLIPFWEEMEREGEDGFIRLGVTFPLVSGEGYFNEVQAFFRALPLYVEWLIFLVRSEIRAQGGGRNIFTALDEQVFYREFQKGLKKLKQAIKFGPISPLTLTIFTPSFYLFFSLSSLDRVEEVVEGESLELFFFRLEIEAIAPSLLKSPLCLANLTKIASSLSGDLVASLLDEKVLSKMKPSGVREVKTGGKIKKVIKRFSHIEAKKRWAFYWCYRNFFEERKRAYNKENLKVFNRAIKKLFAFIEASSPDSLSLEEIERRWSELIKATPTERRGKECQVCGKALSATERGGICGGCHSYKSAIKQIVEVADERRLLWKLIRNSLTSEEVELISATLKGRGFTRSVSSLIARVHQEERFKKLFRLVICSSYPEYSSYF